MVLSSILSVPGRFSLLLVCVLHVHHLWKGRLGSPIDDSVLQAVRDLHFARPEPVSRRTGLGSHSKYRD
jgi:hypothetical protein